MTYYLFHNGSRYSWDKFTSKDEAKKVAEELNARFNIERFGRIYVANKFGNEVA